MKVCNVSKNNKSNRRFRRISILATMLVMVCSIATACGQQTSSTSQKTEANDSQADVTTTQYYYFPPNMSVNIDDIVESSADSTADKKVYESITDPNPDKQAEEIVKLTNEFRTSKGLAALKTDDRLNKAAMERAKELAETFNHTRPNGEDGQDIIKEYDKSAVPSGENMHMSYGKGYHGAQQVADSWTDSTAHQKKILDTDSEYIGVGVYYIEKDGYKYTYAVQLFCKSV
jgi:uncharacterized protein YkwD